MARWPVKLVGVGFVDTKYTCQGIMAQGIMALIFSKGSRHTYYVRTPTVDGMFVAMWLFSIAVLTPHYLIAWLALEPF